MQDKYHKKVKDFKLTVMSTRLETRRTEQPSVLCTNFTVCGSCLVNGDIY